MPRISIIIPCYNQAQYLDECLQSVLDQTFTNWECIIVNDGSPDNTEEIAKKWLEKDVRFKYLYKKNGGLSSARNAGIYKAEGEWILPLDADDKISENYLELAETRFAEYPSIIYSKAEYFGEKDGELFLEKYKPKEFLLKNSIFCSSFFTKKDWENVGGYDENMNLGYEDWEFWISLLKNNKCQPICLPETCFFYRIKESSMLSELQGNKKAKMEAYIAQKHYQLYHDTFGNYLDLIRENQSFKRRLNYYKTSKLHLLTDKIIKLYYKKNRT